MEGGFWTDYAWPAVLLVIKIVAVIVPVVLAMAWLTYAERKVIAAVQLRKGPNVVGWFGLLQPIADGVKLIFKETIIPSGAINVGILYLFAISSLGVYGIIMSGWASNSRYAFLGGLRSAAQMVSYEVSIGLVIVTVLLATGSLNLSEIVTAERPWWVSLLLFPMFVVF